MEMNGRKPLEMLDGTANGSHNGRMNGLFVICGICRKIIR